MRAEAASDGLADGDLVLSARRGPRPRTARRRIDVDRLRGADRGAARRAHHQGQALDRPPRAGRGEEGLRDAEDRRRRPRPTRVRALRAGAAFGGRRIVVFSGGAAKGEDAVLRRRARIRDGGGNGSIIGRNTFQRPRADALAMLDKLVDIYKGRADMTLRRPDKGDYPAQRAVCCHARCPAPRRRGEDGGICAGRRIRNAAASRTRRARRVAGAVFAVVDRADGLSDLRRAAGRARAVPPVPGRGAGKAAARPSSPRCAPSARPSRTRPAGCRPRSLDLDLLDEQARKILGLGARRRNPDPLSPPIAAAGDSGASIPRTPRL